ncbi:MAG: CoA transferase subunit A [Deltaproteobacteria bacterium]|nr:CoA transferase subunit A [Deltaproteobacteria bacterium]
MTHGHPTPPGSLEVLAQGIKPLIQPIDLEGFRAHNRSKPKSLVDKLMTEQEAIGRFLHENDYLGIELYGTCRCPMSLTREVVRQRVGRLRLAGQGVHEADVLLAAGLVEELDFTYIGLEVFGVSPAARRAIEGGGVKNVVEWSNGALSWRFKAAAMGVPFLPSRSMLGTDTLAWSSAKVVRCPFTDQPIALLPALVLDVGLIHVHRADRYGNCQIDGISGFAAEMARASKRLIVSAEEIVDTDTVIRAQPDRTIIPYYLVDAVVHAPYGSHPGEMPGLYERDAEEYKRFLDLVRTEEGMRTFLDETIHSVPDHAGYLARFGHERLAALDVRRPA